MTSVWLIPVLGVVYAAILLTLGLCRAARLGDEHISRLGRPQGPPVMRTIADPLADRPSESARPDGFEYGHRVRTVDGRRIYEVRR